MTDKETKRVATTAERLQEAMRDAGMKQVDLVRAAGVEKGALSRYLTGAYEPKQPAINKMAIALNVSELWLWGYDVPKARSLEQKKNDRSAQLIGRMRRDPEFYNIVEMLDRVPLEQLDNLRGLVAGLVKK